MLGIKMFLNAGVGLAWAASWFGRADYDQDYAGCRLRAIVWFARFLTVSDVLAFVHCDGYS